MNKGKELWKLTSNPTEAGSTQQSTGQLTEDKPTKELEDQSELSVAFPTAAVLTEECWLCLLSANT